MPSTIWCPLTLLLSIAFSQTTPLTTPDGCSANYAYVFIESTLHTLSKTITSERVNYPPYSYTPSVPRRKLVPFALNDPITDTSNNPCDTSTWTIPSISYDNSIILLTYSDHFATICTPQQWTLNLQTYNTNIQALLIANDKDITNVYPLPGDNTLTNPIIPTRMISQSSAKNIKYILNNTNEDIYVSIDCFNNTSPALICIVDQSSIGNTVELDGEFQKQGDIFVNSHPVWLKEGMNGIWDDYYIWLTIDHSYGADAYSWKWVIGTDYNDDSTIYAECLAPWSDHMTDPTQCSGNWYKNQKLLPELVSRNGVCDLGDNYVCVDSGSEMFDTYFGGRYRQVHDNTAIWFGDNTQFDSYLSIQYVNMSFASGWSFVFSFAANGGVHAFCVIQEGESFASYTIGHDSGNMALSPWNCNKNWYVVIYDAASQGYKWFNDPLMDIDQCNHPSVSTQTPKEIIYPKYMCFTDAVNKYSPYQTYFGIWTLDNSSSNQYDNRHVYQNQRLPGPTQGEWYMVWYDKKDSWIIKEEIPERTYTETYIDTPDQCTSCWELYHRVHNEYNFDSKISPILTNNEADCMVQPFDMTLCLGGSIYKYTGKCQLETRYEHNGRKIWYLSNELTGDRDYLVSGERYLESAIPTRMVSQFVGIGIEEAINMGENVYITLGCFDDVSGIDYPSIICLIDTSVIGKYVYLDGEYQRQNIYKNEHPIWMKDGFEGMWKKLYMWLDIDVNINGISSWRWVIGNDYNSKHGIIAACGLDNNDTNHPAECDGHWYINGKLENNITTSDTICELGDNYVCVESADGGLFDYYFDGQYRQIHSGVPLWFLEDG
eukprot:229084_1